MNKLRGAKIIERWMEFILTNSIKNILVIMVHRIPKGTNSKLYSAISQYNQLWGEVNASIRCRNEIF